MILMSDDNDDRSIEGDDQITLMRMMENATAMMRTIVMITQTLTVFGRCCCGGPPFLD